MIAQNVTISAPAPAQAIHYAADKMRAIRNAPFYGRFPRIGAANLTTVAAMRNGIAEDSRGSSVGKPQARIPATPFISPAAGTYTSARTVKITDATAGVTIHYTIDGSAPTPSSPIYTGPFSTTSSASSETVRAFAILAGVYSSATSRTYTIAPPLGAPTFSPTGGNYGVAQEITIGAKAPGKVIHYTTNGTRPTPSSPVYRGTPIPVVAGRISIAAMVAGIDGYSQSPTAAQTYSIIPATPYVSPASGTYTSARTVEISDVTSGVEIHYTTDGTQPTTESPVYTGPFSTPSSATREIVRAFAVSGGVYSAGTSATYTIAPLPRVPAPIISPQSGTYSTSQVVKIADSVPGAVIHYTVDGSTPTVDSARYWGAFSILNGHTGNVVVQAIAVRTAYLPSKIARSRLKLSLPDGVIASTSVESGIAIGAIATDFLGYSHEWDAAQAMMGDSALGVNNIYRTLLGTLSSTMGGPLLLRIGGGTTDTSGPAASGTVEPFAELAGASNVSFILSVNLGSNNVGLAKQQAGVFLAGMPASALTAIEIGNEPDGYRTNGLRPSTYDYGNFLPQFDEWASGVSSVSTSSVPIAGPTFGTGDWIPSAKRDVTTSVLQAAMVTQHKYIACYYPDNPLPSDILLQPSSSTASLWAIQPYAAAAHQKHVPFRMAEINSICNGGQPGVSNTFSSALWAVDTMFEDAKAGIDGVNWKTSYNGGPYDLFHFGIWNIGARNIFTLTEVRPLYYGLLLFAQAAGNNARVLMSQTLTDENVKVWITVDSNAHAHLVIINKEQATAGAVQIALPGYSRGSIVRLRAGSYLATDGITIGGQTYDGSTDGTLQGTAISEPTWPNNGVWTIPVHAMSAVLVNLQP